MNDNGQWLTCSECRYAGETIDVQESLNGAPKLRRPCHATPPTVGHDGRTRRPLISNSDTACSLYMWIGDFGRHDVEVAEQFGEQIELAIESALRVDRQERR